MTVRSELVLGHSAVLFINRVRRSRFVISLIVNNACIFAALLGCVHFLSLFAGDEPG